MPSLKEFSEKTVNAINSGEISSSKDLNRFKLALAKKLGFKELPSNPTILSFAEKKTPELKSFLSIKPTRSLSGVSVVAIMPKPFPCPGKCIYCPSGIEVETPKSYTGREPATMRAIANRFDPIAQINNRVSQLQDTGHSTEKIELIVMGGTFLGTPFAFQKGFVKKCFEAVSGKKSSSLEEAKRNAEKSKNRIIGLTFETRPDFCGKKEINRMLSFGGTRVELGVQQIDDEIYKRVRRGHTVQDVVKATSLLKDSAFKVCYHLIPNLPGSSPSNDLKLFKKIFSDQRFKPDMLKIYPCLVVEGTKLFKEFKSGSFKPPSLKKTVKLIAKMKALVPWHVRIMRVQRDIPSNVISAGVNKSNLREMVKEEMKKNRKKCNCIRCREAGLRSRKESPVSLEEARLFTESFKASNGLERFISFEDRKRNHLFGFCRLRFPSNPFRKEITPRTSLLRELHVYSKSLPLRKKPFFWEFQHRGLGKKLLKEAERVALEELDCTKMAVISGVGAKEYYRGLGYKNDGPYVSRPLL